MPRSRSDRVLLGVGAVLFLAGALLGAVGGGGHYTIRLAAQAARIAALAAFAAVSVRRRSLTPWIFLAMIAGAECGFDAPGFAPQLHFLSDIFLRLIKTIIAPLILATLVTGIAGHGDLRQVGRMGLRSLVYFEVLTTLALAIGLVAINLSKAGVGLALTHGASAATAQPSTHLAPLHWDDFLIHIPPENLAKSIADGQILQVAVFAVLFGVALAALPDARRAPLLRVFEGLGEVMFRFTHLVMYLAPLAVFAAIAGTVAHLGLGVLINLGKLLLTLYAALAVFSVGVLLPVALLAGVPVRRFLRAVAEPATIAFATATSEAALPRAMEAMEALGVPRRVVAFVIPAGYSFNLDGSTLYLALASVFVAQAAGIHLNLGEQLAMMGTLLLTSKGVAGVPRAMLVVLLATAETFHLPSEPIVVLLGVDVLMDMGRTSLNVVGNCLASIVIARWEGVFESELPGEANAEALPRDVA